MTGVQTCALPIFPVPELRADHILPGIFDDRVVDIVKNAVIAEVK